MSGSEDIAGIIESVSPYYVKMKKNNREIIPADQYKLTYDSSSETLEPVYFWILDFMNNLFGGKVEKLVDNFTSSPGSGHFSEIGGRATRMQEEGMKIMQTVGVMIKSLINIIYDLRQFEIRFKDYDASRSKDPNVAEAGLIALKQIWLDNVDIKRGNTSIKAMAFSQTAFVTLIDSFMIVKSEADVKKLDLNERVKRILLQRIHEFKQWRGLSEKELRKRYSIQRTWLKSQVQSLKLYTRWVKPYLVAAEKLSSKDRGREAGIVDIFNTIILQLTIFAKSEIDIKQEVVNKDLPQDFKNLKTKRKYYKCVLIDFTFRGIPRKVIQQSHYAFGGRADVIFKGYCLNEDELAAFEEKLKESDINSALNLVQGATDDTLEELREDIEYFLKDEGDRELDIQEKKNEDDVNPFSALFGFGKKKVKKESKEGEKKPVGIIRKDNYVESVVRELGEEGAASLAFNVFDIYKKAHGMPSHPSPFE